MTSGYIDRLLHLSLVALLLTLHKRAVAEYANSGGCPEYLARAPRWSTLSNLTTVIWPNATEFYSAAPARNMLKSGFPAVIVYPGTERDALQVVRIAAQTRLRLVVRCSGHDYNDRSNGNGIILLETQRLKSISYDNSSSVLTVGAGNTWSDLYAFIKPRNRIVVGGSALSVCAAGCLMGGCFGMFARVYGFGSDNVVGIRFALYNGTILNLSQTVNSDLFNAILGSGASSYGVALSFSIQTHPAPPKIHLFTVTYNITEDYQKSALARFWLNATWLAAMPTDFSWSGGFPVPNKVFRPVMFYVGDDYPAALSYAQSTMDVQGYINGSWGAREFESMFDFSAFQTVIYETILTSWERTMVANYLVPYNQTAMDILGKTVYTTPFRIDGYYGGPKQKTSTVGSISSGMRTAALHAAFGKSWVDPTTDSAEMTNINNNVVPLKPVFPHTYVNLYTSWGGKYNALDDWKTRFYNNYSTLLEVKKKYDPCNLYTVEYGVGSDMPTATCGLPLSGL